jgi:hypothetical protein
MRPPGRLTQLDLKGTKVTGRGVRALAHLRGMTCLYLGDLPVSDDDLDCLRDWPDLRILGLNGTAVTDAGVSRLSRFASLGMLYLPETIAPATARKLAAEIPRCRIQVGTLTIGPTPTVVDENAARRSVEWVLSVGGTVVFENG